MLIIFRADASTEIGSGHVMRCLTLADGLSRKGHKCRFVCREYEGHLGEVVIKRGYELVLLPAPPEHTSNQVSDSFVDSEARPAVSWQDDANQTLAILATLEVDWLVIDHYELDFKWENRLSNVVKNIFVIDDLANRSHQCNLLLDQNLGRRTKDYDDLVPAGCLRLIGPQFALLRPEFGRFREKSMALRQPSTIKKIFISLGGTDKDNITSRILDALMRASLPEDIELDVVMGHAAPHIDEVSALVAKLPFRTSVSVNVSDMARRMSASDFSIGAAGSTSWERCCLGVPSIMVVLADNQRAISKAIERHEAGVVVEVKDIKVEIPLLIETCVVNQKRRSLLSRNAAKICDGNGTARVLSAILKGSM